MQPHRSTSRAIAPSVQRRDQRGVGASGFVFVLIVIGTAAALTIKLVPHYLSHFALIKALEQLDDSALAQSRVQLYKDLEVKVFRINSIYDVEPRDWIDIEKTRNRVVFHVDYRIDEPVIANVGVFVHFKQDVVRTF